MKYKRAIVIGAGMAGLASAAALAPYFSEVRILERDELPDSGVTRRCAPQGKHVHLLLVSGLRALQHLLPSLEQDLISAGGLRTNIGDGMRFIALGEPTAPFASPHCTVLMSRPMLEFTVRNRVEQLDNVQIWTAAKVERLVSDALNVRGVVLENGEQLPADLVVDAGGRGSKISSWLADVGAPVPEQVDYKIGLQYTSRILQVPTHTEDAPRSNLLYAGPKQAGGNRSGVLMQLEGDRHIMTLAGYGGEQAPTTDEGFLSYARSIHPELGDAYRDSTPQGDFATYAAGTMGRRLFSKLDTHASGLITVGDGQCWLDPVYGQGMSIAAMEAEALAELFSTGTDLTHLAPAFYKKSATIIDGAWNTSAVESLRRPVPGPRPAGLGLMHRYIDNVLALTHNHPVVSEAFGSSVHMIVGPFHLFRPAVLGRVVLRELKVLK